MTSLRSHRHELFCENINKTGLSAFDDKRFLLNSVESLAYGHYKIQSSLMEKHSQESSDQMNETSIQSSENPSDEPMDSPPEQVSINQRSELTQIQVETLMFENQVFTPIGDQSLFLDNFKITPCEKIVFDIYEDCCNTCM